jgi:hypothetical protein
LNDARGKITKPRSKSFTSQSSNNHDQIYSFLPFLVGTWWAMAQVYSHLRVGSDLTDTKNGNTVVFTMAF